MRSRGSPASMPSPRLDVGPAAWLPPLVGRTIRWGAHRIGKAALSTAGASAVARAAGIGTDSQHRRRKRAPRVAMSERRRRDCSHAIFAKRSFTRLDSVGTYKKGFQIVTGMPE